jgi:hypothetical protein
MSLFLNTPKLNFWIPKVIKESQKELIIIVPYIQLSAEIFKSLQIADANGVETTLVYRENKLSAKEKQTLLSYKNLNLLHHPNVHAKCYYNGELLIIGSMNLYEYSELNNREMGILLHQENLKIKDETIVYDDKQIFDDAILEIREIINSSQLERESSDTRQNGFELDIIKTYEEFETERCVEINKAFINKKFKPIKTGNTWNSKCENYFEKIDVTFTDRNILIAINLKKQELETLYKKWKETYNEFEYPGFKYYWNKPDTELSIYRDFNSKAIDWENITEYSASYKHYKEVIAHFINKYRSLNEK